MQSPQGIIALTYISGSIMKKCNFTFKILSLSVIQVATLRINAPNIMIFLLKVVKFNSRLF